MMKMTGKAFAKKLFGVRYERLSRTLLLDVIIFWGLYIAGFQVQIAASVRILMISAFTAGVMWQHVVHSAWFSATFSLSAKVCPLPVDESLCLIHPQSVNSQ